MAQVMPSTPILSHRSLISNTYYPSLTKSNVHITTESIHHFDRTGVVDAQGHHVAVDTIIYATGFQDNPWTALGQVQGCDPGRFLWDTKEGPHAYLGIHTHGFPNLHFLYGPNTNTTHQSVLTFLEAQVDLILRAMHQMQAMGYQSLQVKEQAERTFVQEMDDRMPTLSFFRLGADRNQYKYHNGRCIRNWAGGAPEYVERCRNVDWDCYEWA